MDIERVNENTLKLFITYRDIEERGYTREELWFNRAKGEELFWEVMTEVNTDDYFELDGPIWIHINASEVGLEVVVTRAAFNPEADLSSMFQPMEDMPENHMNHADTDSKVEEEIVVEDSYQTTSRYVFKDIDDVIPVANRLKDKGLKTSLYQFENKYYLVIDFEGIENKDEVRNVNAVVREYLRSSKVTSYRLEEYGTVIMQNNCFETVVEFFN